MKRAKAPPKISSRPKGEEIYKTKSYMSPLFFEQMQRFEMWAPKGSSKEITALVTIS